MKKFISFIGILIILVYVSNLEAFDIKNSDEYFGSLYYLDHSSADQPASADLGVEENIESIVPVLELKLVKQEKVNGHLIETYREYEVYKDANGEVMKRNPTGHYEFLKYEM